MMHANKEFDERACGRGSSAIRRSATDNARHRVIREQLELNMEDAIYAKSGAPIGFHDGKFIYDLHGQPIGQLRGSQVYCMGGHYFGKLKKGVILDKDLNRVKSGSSPARGNPGVQSHGSQRNRRNPRNNKSALAIKVHFRPLSLSVVALGQEELDTPHEETRLGAVA